MARWTFDAGHTYTGEDTGAEGCNCKEQEEVRKLIPLVAKHMRNLGHEVKEVRVDHCTTLSESLNNRVNQINSFNPDFSISFHMNAFNGSAYGTEALIDGKINNVANNVLHNLSQLGFSNRGLKDGLDYAVVGSVNKPAMILETCFIDNVGDMNSYRKDLNQVAYYIAMGLHGQRLSKPTNTPSNNIPNNNVTVKKEEEINMILFSWEWYLSSNKDVNDWVNKQGAKTPQARAEKARWHYDNYGKKEGRKPVPPIPDKYCEGDYLKYNSDVANAVKKGVYLSGIAHFLENGWRESRRISHDCTTYTSEKEKQELAELKEKLKKINELSK